MPELPEVEFAGRHLARWLVGQRIARAEVEKSRITRPQRAAELVHALTGRTLQRIDRRAKYLLLTFDGGVGALSHLGMTGKWVLRRGPEPERFSRVRLRLDDGSVVHYADARMFGAFRVVPADKLLEIPSVAALGRDPLVDGLDAAQLGEALARTSRPVKLALMDQSLIAGLGNIHVAEALYRAKVHPSKPAKKLTSEELTALSHAIHATIQFALEREAKAAGDGDIVYVEEGGENPFLVYGRKDERCRRCKTPIQSFTQGGRTTFFCPGCQKLRATRGAAGAGSGKSGRRASRPTAGGSPRRPRKRSRA